jgi:hypothetical protein
VGLISGLLTLPLAPVKGVAWVGEQIQAEAERELDEGARIRTELAQLGMDLDLGRIDEAEYERREDELLERLERLRTPPEEES